MHHLKPKWVVQEEHTEGTKGLGEYPLLCNFSGILKIFHYFWYSVKYFVPSLAGRSLAWIPNYFQEEERVNGHIQTYFKITNFQKKAHYRVL